MILPMVNAESSYTFKQNTPAYLNIPCYDSNGILCTNAVTCTISVDNPNGNIVSGASMTYNTDYFNYTLSDTSVLGSYVATMSCTDGSIGGFSTFDFMVTPSGSLLGDGQGTTLIGSLLVMIIISGIFLFIAIKSENKTAKITFFAITTIGFVMTILYSVIIVQQTLFGFESIQSGMETFWFVAKMGLTIGSVAFGIIIFLVMLRYWKIKRGLIDE